MGEIMEELRDLYGTLLENAIEMMVILDRAGNILYSNRICNEELGFEEGLINVKVSEIIPEEFELEDGFFAETMVYR